MKLVHISDTHAQSETVFLIDRLVSAMDDVDVVALTGDCTSTFTSRVPANWAGWPQPTKLAVPGNHDAPCTFAGLRGWIVDTPFVAVANEVVLLGIDTSSGFEGIPWQLDGIRKDVPRSAPAYAILTHRRPTHQDLQDFCAVFELVPPTIPLLVLHGHDHPRSFRGSHWEPSTEIAGRPCSISKLYSAVDGRRGLIHLIEFEGKFHCSPIHYRRS